jgi:hypothetical protein
MNINESLQPDLLLIICRAWVCGQVHPLWTRPCLRKHSLNLIGRWLPLIPAMTNLGLIT